MTVRQGNIAKVAVNLKDGSKVYLVVLGVKIYSTFTYLM